MAGEAGSQPGAHGRARSAGTLLSEHRDHRLPGEEGDIDHPWREREPFVLVDWCNLFLWSALLFVAVLPGGGRDLYALAALSAVISTTLCVVVAGRFPDLAIAFQLGFVAVVSIEGFFRGEALALDLGRDEYGAASRYLVAGLAAVSIGHALVFRPAREPDRRAAGKVTGDRRVDRQKSVVAIVVLALLYAVGTWPRLTARISTGRIGTFEPWFAGTTIEPLTSGLINAAGMLLPAAIAFHVSRLMAGSIWKVLLLSSPVLVAQFAIGTRFPLLFSVAGILVVRYAGARLRAVQVLRALMVGILLFLLSASMTQFRSVGLSNAASAQLSISQDRIAESERTVENLIEIMQWYDVAPHTNGTSSLTATFFFVPRVLWPDKPLAMGYWFPRRYGEQGFSSGHSIAYSFAGDPYADFGFAGGLVALLTVGIGLGTLDRWCSRRLVRPFNPSIVVAGPLYGAAFFAARSIDTAFIAMCGVFFLGVLYVVFTSRPMDRPTSQD